MNGAARELVAVDGRLAVQTPADTDGYISDEDLVSHCEPYDAGGSDSPAECGEPVVVAAAGAALRSATLCAAADAGYSSDDDRPMLVSASSDDDSDEWSSCDSSDDEDAVAPDNAQPSMGWQLGAAELDWPRRPEVMGVPFEPVLPGQLPPPPPVWGQALVDHAGDLVNVATAVAQVRMQIGKQATWLARREAASPSMPAGELLRQVRGAAASADTATHVMGVMRREYKNLARQFATDARSDGTLRNLHTQPGWKAEFGLLNPLASDTAGMMRKDPGRLDLVDDTVPSVCCKVASRVPAWIEMHVAGCSVCAGHATARVLRGEGRPSAPGHLPRACPVNFGLIAHRLRTGLHPSMAKRPDAVVQDNRPSIGLHWSAIAAAFDKTDKADNVLVGDTFQRPAFAAGLVGVVKDKHLAAARAGGFPSMPGAPPPKGRAAHDLTGCGLNECLDRWPFRYDEVSEAIKLMSPGCFMATLDLRSYFNSLPWSQKFSDEYGWIRDPRRDGGVWPFRGKPPADWPHAQADLPPWRRYACCSFGASCVPAWASTVSGVLATFLRQRGVAGLTFFVDDFILVCDTEAECRAQIAIFEQVIAELGLEVAAEKTTGPVQVLTYLGVQLNSLTMEVTIARERCDELAGLIRKVLAAGQAPRKALHTLLGKLSWCGLVVRGGRAFLRSLINAVAGSRWCRRSVQLPLSDEMREDLGWWLRQVVGMVPRGSRLWINELDITVLSTKSDASGRLGWGLVFGDELHFSKWTPSEATDPNMALKELVPILYLAENYGERLAGKIVRVGIDNSSAVFDLLRSDSRDPQIRRLIKRIALAQAEWDFDLVAVHCTRELNKLADLLTRFAAWEELADGLPDGWKLPLRSQLPACMGPVQPGVLLATSPWRLGPGSAAVWHLKLVPSDVAG